MSFDDFKLSEPVITGLKDLQFEEPTPIQQESIPAALEGKDLIASAQTGTGKTAAFVVPIVEQIYREKDRKGIQAVILTPTRELALQIDEQIWAIGYHAGVSSVTVYGGGDWGKQEKALKQGVDIVVATPGRLIDHLRTKELSFSTVKYAVLDEADRMLDMGFLPAVNNIMSRLPKKKQTFLFSATIQKRVEKLAQEYLSGEVVRVNVATQTTAKGVNQRYFEVHHRLKTKLLVNLVEQEKWDSSIVFTGTKRDTDILARQLSKTGLNVATIHGDRDQKEREDALREFKSGRASILVATDVVARGIDIDGVSHVVNYDVPKDTDDYIHRVGRTARADASGEAVTFCSPRDKRYMKQILDKIGDDLKLQPLPEIDDDEQRSSNQRDRGPQRTNPASQKVSEKASEPDDPDNDQQPREDRDRKERDNRRSRENRNRGRGKGRGQGRNQNRPQNRREDDRQDDRRTQAAATDDSKQEGAEKGRPDSNRNRNQNRNRNRNQNRNRGRNRGRQNNRGRSDENADNLKKGGDSQSSTDTRNSKRKNPGYPTTKPLEQPKKSVFQKIRTFFSRWDD